MSGLGDIDGDGCPDWVVSAPMADDGKLADAGLLAVLSGATGKPITSLRGTGAYEMLGVGVDAGADIDGNGFRDIVASSRSYLPAGGEAGVPAPAIRVFSARKGTHLLSLTGADLGSTTSWTGFGVPDIDGDGRGEIGALGAGMVILHSPSKGRRVLTLRDEKGEAAAAGVLDDLDGDGRPEIGIGWIPGTGGDPGKGYWIQAASTAQGGSLWRAGVEGPEGRPRFLLDAGDLDGDRIHDLLVLDALPDPWRPHEWKGPMGAPPRHRSRLHAVSGKSGGILWSRVSQQGLHAPWNAVAAVEGPGSDGGRVVFLGEPMADLDGEFRLENPGVVRVLEGRSGKDLRTIRGPRPGGKFGTALSSAPVPAAKGRPALLVGAPGLGMEEGPPPRVHFLAADGEFLREAGE